MKRLLNLYKKKKQKKQGKKEEPNASAGYIDESANPYQNYEFVNVMQNEVLFVEFGKFLNVSDIYYIINIYRFNIKRK